MLPYRPKVSCICRLNIVVSCNNDNAIADFDIPLFSAALLLAIDSTSNSSRHSPCFLTVPPTTDQPAANRDA